jgi:ACR3 family arsenite efflux pump ArsB
MRSHPCEASTPNVALLVTLVLLFAFQGEAILHQPLIIIGRQLVAKLRPTPAYD